MKTKIAFVLGLFICVVLNSCSTNENDPVQDEQQQELALSSLEHKSLTLTLVNSKLADKVRFDIGKTIEYFKPSSENILKVSNPYLYYKKISKTEAIVELEFSLGKAEYFWSVLLTFTGKNTGKYEGMIEYGSGGSFNEEGIYGNFSISDYEEGDNDDSADNNDDENAAPEVNISSPVFQEITNTSVVVKGTVLGDNVEFEDRGFCYSTNQMPTVDDVKIAQNVNVINKTLTNLYEGTTYYVRLYAKVDGEYYYGEEAAFTTEGERVTKVIFNIVREISNLTNSRIEINAVLPNEIEYYGLCYSKTPKPQITDNYLPEANRKKSWTLSKLECGSEYYVRAYHIEGSKIIYYENTETKIVPLDKDQIQYEFKFTDGTFGSKNSYSLSITLNNLPLGTYEIMPTVWRWKDAYYQSHEGKNYLQPKKYLELVGESATIDFSGSIALPESHGMGASRENYSYHLDGFSVKPVDNDETRMYTITFVDENL